MTATDKQRDLYARWLTDLARPYFWRVERGVPVFRAHELPAVNVAYASGAVERHPATVTDADLIAVTRRTNARRPITMTMGRHRNYDPNCPDASQPALAGLALNYRLGRFTPDRGRTWAVGILADLFYRAELYDVAGPARYPLRSAVYDGPTGALDGLALVDGVKHVPCLDLGALPYCQLTRPDFHNGG